jgi:hypothetical protein
MSEREELENELRALIGVYKALKCERESCLASIRARRAGLLHQNLGTIVAAVERDLVDTVSEICRVGDRLLQVAAASDAPAPAQERPRLRMVHGT